MTHPFDAATALTRDGDRFTGQASERYWAFVGAYGGFTAATVLRAFLEHPDRAGDPLALTVNYAAPVAAGPFEIAVRLVRGNRSSQHWSAELTQGGETAVTATAVFAARPETWSHQPTALPRVPPASSLPAYAPDTAPEWIRQYEFRFATGAPTWGETPNDPLAPALTQVWISDAEPRPVDHLALASMGDAFIARIFHVLGKRVPIGTVSMTTYFHASAEDLATEALTQVIGQADARSFHRAYSDQTAELWSPSGRLLATAHQMTYFKA